MDPAAVRRIHPLVQRRALAVRGHDPDAALARDRLAARPSAPWRAGRRDQPDRSSDLARARRRPSSPSTTGMGATSTTCAAGSRTSRCSIPVNGSYRGPSSQQGYSPFSTWTRGLAWALTGFAELLEFIDRVPNEALERHAGRVSVEGFMMEAARATADFYIEHAAAADGVPYWDTGAPGLMQLGDWASRDADPFNPPRARGQFRGRDCGARTDSSRPAARSAAQDGSRYTQAGLRTLATLLDPDWPVSQPRAGAPRPAPARGVSPAQRLGRASWRRAHAARRIRAVGRLPSARGRAPRATSC